MEYEILTKNRAIKEREFHVYLFAFVSFPNTKMLQNKRRDFILFPFFTIQTRRVRKIRVKKSDIIFILTHESESVNVSLNEFIFQ